MLPLFNWKLSSPPFLVHPHCNFPYVSLAHSQVRRLPVPTVLVREASVCLVSKNWNMKSSVFTLYIAKSCIVHTSYNFYVKLTLLFFFFLQFLNDFSSGSDKLQKPKEIIMKLYVFLVNTGTTLTFDTELAVQK